MKIQIDSGEIFDVYAVDRAETAIRSTIRIVRTTLDDIDKICATKSLVVIKEDKDNIEVHYDDINFNYYLVGRNHDVEIWFYQEQGQRVTHLTQDVGSLKQNSNQTAMTLDLLVNEIIPSLSPKED